MDVTIPADVEAERAVIGGCMAFTDALADVLPALDPTDFYDPAMAKLWMAFGELHGAGAKVDHVTVMDACGRRGWAVRAEDVVDLVSNGLRPRPEHVAVILRHSVARRLMTLTGAVRAEVGAGADPYVQLEQMKADLGTIDLVTLDGRQEARTLDDIVANADDMAPWVVPGMMRRDWRAIVVGREGGGKSTLLRQIAASSAQGIHPLMHNAMEPIRTLLVDLENPAAAIAEIGSRLVDRLRVTTGERYDPQRFKVLMRPGGVNLRTRQHRIEVEREITAHRPDLVVMGPVYKMSQRKDGESYEDATDPVLRILDDLRTRHGFALILEHHAPQANGGVRDIRPFGSQRWLAWPEMGIGMRDNKVTGNVSLSRWRGDRLKSNWPDEISHSTVWPWTGIWAHRQDDF